MMLYTYLDSPIGSLLLAGEPGALRFIGFPSGPQAMQARAGWQEDAEPFVAAAEQLTEYFAGERQQFDLPLAPQGTPFQQSVWRALLDIPFGATCSYGDIAKLLGKPKAVRAVGGANGRNPLPIVVPCHRVIGSNGKLTGFGGGLDTKRYLLALEAGSDDLLTPLQQSN